MQQQLPVECCNLYANACNWMNDTLCLPHNFHGMHLSWLKEPITLNVAGVSLLSQQLSSNKCWRLAEWMRLEWNVFCHKHTFWYQLNYVWMARARNWPNPPYTLFQQYSELLTQSSRFYRLEVEYSQFEKSQIDFSWRVWTACAHTPHDTRARW